MSKKQAQKILADPSNFADNFSLSTITALIERTDKGEGLLYTGDFSDVLANHFSQIEKYKAYAQAVEDINTIVQQPAVDTYLKYSDKGLGIKNLLELIPGFQFKLSIHIPESSAKQGKPLILFPNSDFIFAFSIKFIPLSNGSLSNDSSFKDIISTECLLNNFFISLTL